MKKLLITGVLVLGLAVSAPVAKAQTVAELQAMIAQLMAQLAALGGTTTTTTFTYTHTVTLKVGSRGDQVKSLQSALNSLGFNAGAADGIFGNGTKAAVVAFQASKGLTADGIVGPSTGAALTAATAGSNNNNGGSNNNGGEVTSGEAGDLDVDSTTTDVESSVKEGAEENVLGLDLEADGSDIEVTSIRVQFDNPQNAGSTRFDRYVEEVLIYVDGEEVGSMDADEFSKSGSTYTKSISLDDAVVKEGKKAKLHVAVKALNTVNNLAKTWDAEVTQLRFVDGTGAIFTADLPTHTETFGFTDIAGDDDLAIKSNNHNPEKSNLIAEENKTSDDHMIGAFRFEVDEDSSDIALVTVPVEINVSNYDVDMDGTVETNGDDDSTANAAAEKFIDSLWVEIDGEEFEAELIDSSAVSITNGIGTLKYAVEVDEDFVIDSGDTVDVEIYAKFKKQDGNYNSGVVLSAKVAGTGVDAEGEDTLNASGTFTGNDHTVLVSGAAATFKSSSFTAENVTDGIDGTVSITFEVEAVKADVTIAEDGSDLVYVLTGATNETDAIVTVQGMTADGSGNFVIADGAKKTVTLAVKFNTTTGFVRLAVTEVDGTAVTNIITPAY